jgi:hypothetical protein
MWKHKREKEEIFSLSTLGVQLWSGAVPIYLKYIVVPVSKTSSSFSRL